MSKQISYLHIYANKVRAVYSDVGSIASLWRRAAAAVEFAECGTIGFSRERSRMSRLDEVHLMAKVAHMYYGQGIRQVEITERLNIHQSTVSRLLKRAIQAGIVRITVAVPAGVHPQLEQELEQRYGLVQAIVVDCVPDEEQIIRNIGASAAFFVETTAKPNQVIGLSSWSSSLLAMLDAMRPTQCAAGSRVVQILGGVGIPGVQVHATQLAHRLASLIGGTPVLLPAPGVVSSPRARNVLLKEPCVEEAVALFDSLDIALVGIGALEPSKLLASSGNRFSPAELSALHADGAVGDICLRFFNEAGEPVRTPLNDRVIGVGLNQLRRVPRVVGIAGGSRKLRAILAALRGNWINVLITDSETARVLLKEREQERESVSRRSRLAPANRKS